MASEEKMASDPLMEKLYAEVRKLVESGASIEINQVDRQMLENEADKNSIFKSDTKRCIQYARLPNGEIICIKYED